MGNLTRKLGLNTRKHYIIEKARLKLNLIAKGLTFTRNLYALLKFVGPTLIRNWMKSIQRWLCWIQQRVHPWQRQPGLGDWSEELVTKTRWRTFHSATHWCSSNQSVLELRGGQLETLQVLQHPSEKIKTFKSVFFLCDLIQGVQHYGLEVLDVGQDGYSVVFSNGSCNTLAKNKQIRTMYYWYTVRMVYFDIHCSFCESIPEITYKDGILASFIMFVKVKSILRSETTRGAVLGSWATASPSTWVLMSRANILFLTSVTLVARAVATKAARTYKVAGNFMVAGVDWYWIWFQGIAVPIFIETSLACLQFVVSPVIGLGDTG